MYRRLIRAVGGKIMFYVTCVILLILTVMGGLINPRYGAFSASLFALYLITAFTAAYFRQKKLPTEESVALLARLNESFFTQFSEPVAIISEADELILTNEAFRVLSGSISVGVKKTLASVTNGNVTYRKLASLRSGDPFQADAFGKHYEVSSVIFPIEAKRCAITVWNDVTELYRLRRDISDKNPLVCFIVVDNSSELNQNVLENYRSASAKVSRVLSDWADGFDAVLKEYERDKYIMLFEERHLEAMIADKFAVLDTIRQTTEDELGVPLTVSAGIARMNGSLTEKEQAAAQALSLALQRGGDQVVLKNETDTLFFGGRTKTMQKLTKIRSRIIANELVTLMESSDKVIVMGHRFADHDCIGACIGIARMAMHNGKPVSIIVNRDDENLKLVFKKMEQLEQYDDIFIDKITGQDRLTPETLLVIVDVNNVALYEAPDIYENAQKIAVIDHHRKTGEFKKDINISYIEPSASSASELVSELLEQSLQPNSILKDEAEMLLSGIILDTKNFTSNAGVRTFSAAMYLRGEGADPQDTSLLFKSSYDEYMRQIRFINNTYVYRDTMVIAYSDYLSTEKDKIAAAKLADRMLNMEGIEASFVLCSIDGTVHISARSTGSINVQLILEPLKGGGRFDNAGAQLAATEVHEALRLLEGAIDRYIDGSK